jgi:hypothetical protein
MGRILAIITSQLTALRKARRNNGAGINVVKKGRVADKRDPSKTKIVWYSIFEKVGGDYFHEICSCNDVDIDKIETHLVVFAQNVYEQKGEVYYFDLESHLICE